jgi:hypothetical protein
LPITDVPDGRYCLVATVDPSKRLTESDDGDNATSDLLGIRGPHVHDLQRPC